LNGLESEATAIALLKIDPAANRNNLVENAIRPVPLVAKTTYLLELTNLLKGTPSYTHL
jgi:hypothetical protein